MPPRADYADPSNVGGIVAVHEQSGAPRLHVEQPKKCNQVTSTTFAPMLAFEQLQCLRLALKMPLLQGMQS
jgi:hypothetical protein